MNKLIVSLALPLTFACRPSVEPGPPGVARSSSVVVLGLVDAGTSADWRPLCGGVATSPTEVTTALDCVVPKGVMVVQLAVADYGTWMTTSAGMTPALVEGADYDSRVARLRVVRPLSGAKVAIPAARGFADGDYAYVAANPERVERAVVMSAGEGRGLVSVGHDDCGDVINGAGVYDVQGQLVGIVTKSGITASEYAAVAP